MTEHDWKPARKKPVEVEYRGPYTDTGTIETIEGDFEVDEEYIEEHGGYVIIRGVEGEEYPCGLDIFRGTYDTIEDAMQCEVCDIPVDTETDFDKFDPRAPVYTDDGAYHLGCEDGIFEKVFERANNTNWKLCYVRDNWAWFTTHSLDELSGDDWNDSPYQCNGSLPYEPTCAFKDEGTYLKVAFDGCLKEASQVHGSNNNISMNDLVHRKSVPWLQTNKHDLKYNEDLEHVNIFAGVSVEEFEELVGHAGGRVYYPSTFD